MRYSNQLTMVGLLLLGVSAASLAETASQDTDQGTYTRVPNENHAAPTPKAPITSTQAPSIEQWLKKTHLETEARLYSAYQGFSGNHSPLGNTHAYSLGGFIDGHTADVYGISADVGVYTGQSLGLNPSQAKNAFVYLPYQDETALGQAYLQVQHSGFRLRAGRQFIDTPFASTVKDRQLVPDSFEGISFAYAVPDTGLTLDALRMFRFKPYNKSDFERGDAGFRPDRDVNPFATLPSVESDGFLALGADYAEKGRQLRAWYYDFYNRLRLGYVEVDTPLPFKVGPLTPIAGVQYVHEWDAGSQVAPFKNVDADLYGAKLGLASKRNTVIVGLQYNPTNKGYFEGGGLVTPYSYSEYNDTPLYTRQIIASIATTAQPQTSVNIKDILHVGAFDVIAGYKYFNVYAAPAFNHPRTGGIEHAGFAVINYHVSPRFMIQNVAALHKTSGPLGTVSTERLNFRYSFDVN